MNPSRQDLTGLDVGPLVRDLPVNSSVPEYELLRRCAVVRSFDPAVVDAVLRHVPTEIGPETVSFERLEKALFVEAVPRAHKTYRLTEGLRARWLAEWMNQFTSLEHLSTNLVAYYRDEKKPLEELYHLAIANPRLARERFETMYEQAETAFDLALCENLLDLFSDARQFPTSLLQWNVGLRELLQSCDERRARLNARALWADDFLRTGRYLERSELKQSLEALLSRQNPYWALQVHAPGGAGKTMLLRWAIARVCVPRGIPVARLDFDDSRVVASQLVQQPWRLALALARQWNSQIVGEPLGQFVDALTGPSGPTLTSPLDDLASHLKSLPTGASALLILDTLEEVLVPARGTLLALLGLIARFQKSCDRLIVILSGRYDLRARLGTDWGEFGPAVIDCPVSPFQREEAREYLTRLRGLPPSDVVEAIIERAEGNPLKLSLYTEILQGEPGLSAADIRADSRVDVEYLIRRVVLRLKDKDAKLSWVLRYGAIPRRLTREFLKEVMKGPLEREIREKGSVDNPRKGLPLSLQDKEPFHREPAGAPIDLDALWRQLKEYAGTASWVRVVTEAGSQDDLVLSTDVLNPMRDLLREQEKNVFVPLHEAALAYFRRKADSDPDNRLRWLREVVYHDFQLRGESAGADWRDLIESEECRSHPEWRRDLAQEVVGRSYIEDTPAPRPLQRRDGKRMIAPDDLVLAYFHLGTAHIDLARADTSAADPHWKEAIDAAGRLDQAVLGLSGPLPRAAGVLLFQALVRARLGRNEIPFALTLLRAVQAIGDHDERRRALLEIADLQVHLGDRRAQGSYVESLDAGLAGEERLHVLERLAEELLMGDQISAALARCEEAVDIAGECNLSRRRTQLDLLRRRVLLRAGRPAAALELLPAKAANEQDSTAIDLLAIEALLQQCRPLQARARFQEIVSLRRQPPASPGGTTTSPDLSPAELELGGRVAAELMGWRNALGMLESARVAWNRSQSSEDAERALALAVEMQLYGLGDLKSAESLLGTSRYQLQGVPSESQLPRLPRNAFRQRRDPIRGVPSESQLRLELLLAEVNYWTSATGIAQDIIQRLLDSVSPDWPPRYRVWLALQGLILKIDPVYRFLPLLVNALEEITPVSARAALLSPLERVDADEIGPHLKGERFLVFLPEPSWAKLSARDTALLTLRFVEALRVYGGRDEEATARLAEAREVLLADSETAFPLRYLLLAEERLGHTAEAFQRGEQLLPRFLEEFNSFGLLCTAVLVEHAARAEVVQAPAAGRILDQAEERLASCDPAYTTRLSANLHTIRARHAARSGQSGVEPHRDAAIAAYRKLGVVEPRIPVEFAHTTKGSVRIGGSAEVEIRPAPAEPLQPVPPALTFRVRLAPDGGVLIETGTPPGLRGLKSTGPGDRVVSRLELTGAGLRGADPSEGIVSFSIASAFAENWRKLEGAMARLLHLDEVLDWLAQAHVGDLRLEIEQRDLSPLPWECLRRSSSEKYPVEAANPLRYLYRSARAAGTGPVPIRWLQNALRLLVDPDLAVDGVDGSTLRAAVRAFQAKANLPETGQADGRTRWTIDNWMRSMHPPAPNHVLIIAPEQQESGTRAGSQPQLIDLEATYRREGYNVHSIPGQSSFLVSDFPPLAIFHIAAGLAEAPSLGVHFLLNDGKAGGPGNRPLTVSLLDGVLKSLPETQLRPLIILDPPRPSSPVEAVRQLFLRNAFAAELFRLGNAPFILGTGLGSPDSLAAPLWQTLARLNAGWSVGELVRDIHSSLPTEKEPSLDELVSPAGVALFAQDPESRVPGAGSAVSPSPSPQEATPVSRTIYALLVGINDYPEPVRKLHGCVNDITQMNAFLEKRIQSGVVKSKILTNAQATRQAVIDAFRSHLGQAGPDDVALFCYSGHGSQEQAPEEFWHLEPDHLNETLVCYDSRLPGSWDLADKELAKLIGEVSDKKAHVVVLLDCCHSGSGTRRLELAETEVRRCPTDLRQRPSGSYIVAAAELNASSNTRDLSARPAGWNIARRHVLLAACRDDEEAREYQGGGQIRGAFSYFLGETLTTIGPEITYRDLFARADALVRTQVKGQSPQLEATEPADLGQPFLGGVVRPRPAFFTASLADGTWSIDAGRLLGIPEARPGEDTIGLALYDFAASDDDLKDPARAKYRARVTSVKATTSSIEIEGGADPATAPLKAVITHIPTPHLKFRLEGPDNALALVRSALARAAPGNKPSLYVREAAKNEGADYRVIARDNRYLIAKPDDERPVTAGIDGWNDLAAGAVIARLEHIERWKSTAELNNPSTSIRDDEVEVEIQSGGKAITDSEIRLEYTRAGSTWKEPSVKIRLKNKGQRTLYFALLDLPETFGIFPMLRAVGSQKLDAGQETFANNGEEIPCSIPDDLWAQGICEIKDVVKVVVGTSEFDARRLAQDDLPIYKTPQQLEAAKGLSGTRGGSVPGGTLERLMERVQTRHVGGTTRRIDDWRCLQRTFTTVRPLAAQPLQPGRAATLTEGVTIEPHRALQAAEVRLDTAPVALRGISAAPPLPRLLYDDPRIVQPFEFTTARAVGGSLNVLELRGVNDPALVTEKDPLVITVPQPLPPGDYVLPVGPDGEFYLPLGRAERVGNQTRILLERLPQPTDEGTKSLGGALRIFFQKVVSRFFGTAYAYPILAVADVDEQGEVQYQPDPATVKDRVRQAQRIVLFVHGIIGDTRDMAGSLRRAGISDRYDLVLTFDYENLNDPIGDTAVRLKQRLEAAGLLAGSGKKLDIVAHSMGGLVSRWFIEQLGGNQVVRRLVMLGTPNHGSPWPNVVDWATTALTVGLNGLSKIAWPATVLSGLVQASSQVRVALDQMNPSSPFLQNLFGSGDPKLPYVMIAGNTSRIAATAADADRQSRLRRLLAKLWSNRTKYDLADLFFGGANNDIAVSLDSMRYLAQGRQPACDVHEVACDHVSYFRDEGSLKLLAGALPIGT
jgi:hypothetical protein